MDILQLLGSKLYIFLLAIAAVQTAGRKGLHFLRKPMCTLGVKWRKKSKKNSLFFKVFVLIPWATPDTPANT